MALNSKQPMNRGAHSGPTPYDVGRKGDEDLGRDASQ